MLGLTGLVYASMGTLEVFLGLSAGFWVGLFQLPEETAALTVELVQVFAIFAIVFWPSSFALPNGLRAAGDVRYTVYVGAFSMVAFRLGSARLSGAVLGWGVTGVWIAMGMDWLARFTCFVHRYYQKSWQSCRVITS